MFAIPVLTALLLTGCGGGAIPAEPGGGPGSPGSPAAPGSPTPQVSDPTPPQVAELHGSWLAVEMTPPVMLPGREPRLVLQGDRVAAQAGCNNMGGSYRADGTRLLVEGLMSTMRACAPELMTQEGFVSQLLGASPDYVLDGDRLTLSAGERRMVLERHGSPPPPMPPPSEPVDPESPVVNTPTPLR